MTLSESLKSAVGFGENSGTWIGDRQPADMTATDTFDLAASRQEMSEARLPMQYRDSCAHLLIPLNRCRQAEYYLPWKCEVRSTIMLTMTPRSHMTNWFLL